jgi:DNA-binding transcriptional regulator GbsR (MarR family)
MDRLSSLSLAQSTPLNFSTQKVVSILRECLQLVLDSKTTRTGWRKDKFALPTDALERTLKRSAESIVRLYQETLDDLGDAIHTFDRESSSNMRSHTLTDESVTLKSLQKDNSAPSTTDALS